MSHQMLLSFLPARETLRTLPLTEGQRTGAAFPVEEALQKNERKVSAAAEPKMSVQEASELLGVQAPPPPEAPAWKWSKFFTQARTTRDGPGVRNVWRRSKRTHCDFLPA